MSETTAPDPKVIPSFSTVIGQRADPYRRQGRVRIGVDVIPKTQMIGESMVPQGKALVDVPVGMLPLIQALVIDETREGVAVEQLERKNEEWLKENPEGSKLLSPHSVASVYRGMFGHDIGALRYCKVIEEGLPAPLSIEEERAANVAASIARTNSGGKRR